MTGGRVHVLATGGTISSHHDGERWTNLTGAELVAELGPLATTVTVSDVATGPSSSLSVSAMADIATEIGALVAPGPDGVAGIVVTHGTDTMELTAWVVDLAVAGIGVPVVFSGSMRTHSDVDPDGPANMIDAIRVAASPMAHGHGVLVCMHGQIHSASQVTKVDTTSPDAFRSIPSPVVGFVDADGVRLADPARRRRRHATGFSAAVPLLTVYPGMTPEALAAATAGAEGVVLEVFGDLNVPMNLWETVADVSAHGAIVVLASRAYTPTFRDDDLDLLGVCGTGGLSAQKARLALMAALGSTSDREDALAFFGDSLPGPGGER